MTAENLEWLALSVPAVPTPKKQTQESAAPCPTCGWPVEAQLKTCPHCGYTLSGGPAQNLLDALNISLPPRTINVDPAPNKFYRRQRLSCLR